MFPHTPISFPRLTQLNRDTGRVYRIDEGDDIGAVFPSITRVLAAQPNPGLDAWRQRVGDAKADATGRAATWRGTHVHTLAEQYLNNTLVAPTLPPTVQELWRYLRPWMDDHIQALHAQECDVYSQKLRVAGRMDVLATVDGHLSIVDFKTSTKPKRPEYVEKYFIQGTFYALAVYERTGRPVKHIVIPIVSPEGLQVFTTTPAQHVGALCRSIHDFYATTPSL